MNDVPRLRDLLDGVTGRLGFESALSTGTVWERWIEIVGTATALHAEPTSLRRGVLRIRTDSPAWATEIGYLADDIRVRANEVAGRELVREVRVWTSPAPIRPRAVASEPVDGRPRLRQESEPGGDPIRALERARRAWSRRAARERRDGPG